MNEKEARQLFPKDKWEEINKENFFYLAEQPIDMLLWWLLSSCDMYCAYIKEKEFSI